MSASTDYQAKYEHARVDFHHLQSRTRRTISRITNCAAFLHKYCSSEKRAAREHAKMTAQVLEQTESEAVEDSKLGDLFCKPVMAMVNRRINQADAMLSNMIEPWEAFTKFAQKDYKEILSLEAKHSKILMNQAVSVSKRRQECQLLFSELNDKIQEVGRLEKSSKKRSKRD
eukprot:823175_1